MVGDARAATETIISATEGLIRSIRFIGASFRELRDSVLIRLTDDRAELSRLIQSMDGGALSREDAMPSAGLRCTSPQNKLRIASTCGGTTRSKAAMINVPDETRFAELARRAAKALIKAGFEHRIEIYRDVEIEDPVIRKMLGRSHSVRVRVKITAQSLLFDHHADVVVNGVVTVPQNARSVEARRVSQEAANAPGAGEMLRPTGS